VVQGTLHSPSSNGLDLCNGRAANEEARLMEAAIQDFEHDRAVTEMHHLPNMFHHQDVVASAAVQQHGIEMGAPPNSPIELDRQGTKKKKRRVSSRSSVLPEVLRALDAMEDLDATDLDTLSKELATLKVEVAASQEQENILTDELNAGEFAWAWRLELEVEQDPMPAPWNMAAPAQKYWDADAGEGESLEDNSLEWESDYVSGRKTTGQNYNLASRQ